IARRRPHDLANAAAAAAVALSLGADDAAVAAELASFAGLAHRLQTVARVGGVAFHDDSKATTPHAVLAAMAGFDGAVLIAGGRMKGVDLAPLAALAPRLAAVVAVGEAAPEIAALFEGRTKVARAASMREAVDLALSLAQPGGDVVLSPGCASFDWYRDYAERGDDFAAEVERLAAEAAS
ncbi:MAG TPA: UDP-N-acetylmuramoyl-L-alanine--D-glutamate ligase, partial [Acidimicrobiaceae bacterium]|nr:UDP-N-acetylmuramoyl-L-alanine--D-glutamate ligase [Acidimicrobiaceae bacterium]